MTTLDNTFGALLVGVVIAAVLYGVICIQTWHYFAEYPFDPWCLKLLVIVILISNTLQQALITHAIYTNLVTGFAVTFNINDIVWSSVVEVFFNIFTIFIVQCFLAWRVYKLSGRSLLALGSVMVSVTAGFAMTMVLAVKAAHFKTYRQFTSLKDLSMAVNANAAAGDIYIAGFLCYLLQRSRTGFRRSDTMITKLIVFTINTGLLTSVCALCQLIVITVRPDSFMYIVFYYCVGRLYCNTLLATLNGRRSLRSESTDNDTSFSLSLQGQSLSQVNPIATRRTANAITIKVDTTQEYVHDGPLLLKSENLEMDTV